MTDFHVIPELLYVIPAEKHSAGDIRSILEAHPEIKFVSLAAVDLMGNDTDEKIPISDFKSNLENYLNGHAVQTDGSSVVLPGIATLNDGKVDLIPDPEVIWYIDYNYEHTDPITKLPIGTLRIPSFLKHGDDMVCSRSILKKSADFFEKQIKDIFKQRPDICNEYGFQPEDLAKITLITATELEFWVNSPDEIISTEQLSISQELKESYWKRTKGVVRTALEQVIMVLEQYGFNPEMGHKEVGGVKASLTSSREFYFIMEQLEVDWKYSDALQGADYELIARILIKEIFRLHGLDVSFDAKPLQGVAGSGEHTHVNAVANLKDGRKINLFTPADMSKDYLSKIGWGCLMGIMKHYNIISPFVSATTDAFERGDIDWIQRSDQRMNYIILIIAATLIFMIAISPWVYEKWIGDSCDVPFMMTCMMAIYIFLLILSMRYSYFLNGIGALRLQLYMTIMTVVFIPASWAVSYYTHDIIWFMAVMSLCVTPSIVVNMIQFHKILKGTAKGLWRK